MRGGWDYLIADGAAHRLYLSHGTQVEVVDLTRDSTVTIFDLQTLATLGKDDPDDYTVVANVATRRGARTLALDPTTHCVFLSTAEFGPPPAPTPERPRPRPSILPGSFKVLVLEFNAL